MYLNVPFGLLSAALVFLSMPPTPDQHPRPFDAVGVVSMASFLVLFLLAVSEGRRYGWDAPMIVTLFVLAGIALLIFLVTELTVTVPFVDLRLHTNLPFTMGCLIGFLNTMEFRGTNFLMPIMLQHLFHYTPLLTGLFFLPPALVMGVTSILAGRLSDLVQPRLLLALGLLVLTAVSFQFCAIDGWATGALLLGLITLRRAAQAFCHSPLTTATLHGIPEEQIHMASGVFNLHRTLAGAIGVAMTATVLEYREDVHMVILSERQAPLPPGDPDRDGDDSGGVDPGWAGPGGPAADDHHRPAPTDGGGRHAGKLSRSVLPVRRPHPGLAHPCALPAQRPTQRGACRRRGKPARHAAAGPPTGAQLALVLRTAITAPVWRGGSRCFDVC